MNISGHPNDPPDYNEFLPVEAAEKQLAYTQILIDVMATNLVAMRQHVNTLGLSDITLKEIRILEGKLIKHFSQQLDAKQRVNPQDTHDLNHYPSLSTLLTVAGIGPTPTNGLNDQGRSVEDLMRLSDIQLQCIITEMGGTSEDGRKLISALALLGKFQKNQETDTTDLYWDSWSKGDEDVFNADVADSHDYNENLSIHHKPYIENGSFQHSNGGSRNDSESSGSLPFDGNALPRTHASTDPSTTEPGADSQRLHSRQIPSTSSSCLTPPSPSHGSRSSLESSDSGLTSVKSTSVSSQPPRISMTVTPSTASSTASFQTPPVTPGTPHKVPHNIIQSNTTSQSSSGVKVTSRARVASSGQGTSLGWQTKPNPNTLMPPFNKLKPSKSSEWHIGNRILPSTSSTENISASNQSLTSISAPSSKHFPSKSTKKNKRPHDLFLDDVPNFIAISRTASRRSSTTISPESTILNNASPLSPRTPMTPATPGSTDMWSRDRDMTSYVLNAPHTPKSSKSSFKFLRSFFTKIVKKPKLKRNRSTELLAEEVHLPPPSSDIPRRRSDTLPSSDHRPIIKPPPSPEICVQCNWDAKSAPPAPGTDSLFPPESTLPSSPASLTDTDKTLIPDPLDDKSATLVLEASTGGGEPQATSTLAEDKDSLTKDNLFRQTMHSEEWDIPYSQLEFCEKIGRGRVGTVYRGNWHGDVAVRVIDVNHNDEEKLKAFKQEIMIYMKTRHENVELFMGSCMNPPHLAIVTGFCRGHSLYNFIRTSKTQYININQAKIIAQHIVQGMGYLHSKGIIHKDLKSKNIFVDGKKVVITDFGLVGLHAVSCDNIGTTPGVLMIPDGWLCYLAPEVIKALRFPESESDDVISTLPYTMKSDIYAFGTVWYELLSKTWPFNGYAAESIIWQVGSGKKQNLSQLQGGKDVKDILMQSWAYDPESRSDFSDNGIMGILKKLQMQIPRSLSTHPRRPGANRGVSHERLFDGPPLRHAPFSTMHDLAE